MIKNTTGKRAGAVRATLALASVVGIGTVGTLAAWTDKGEERATFSAGSIDLKFGAGNDNPTAITSLSFSNAVPGTVKVAPLTVNNAGTLGFNYVMETKATSTSSTSLAPALRVTVVAGASTCSASGITGGTTLVNAAPLSNSIALGARALTSGATESLCFKVELPADAAQTYQGTNATANFEFIATQS